MKKSKSAASMKRSPSKSRNTAPVRDSKMEDHEPIVGLKTLPVADVTVPDLVDNKLHKERFKYAHEYDEIEAVRKKRELEEQKRSKAKTRKLVAKVPVDDPYELGTRAQCLIEALELKPRHVKRLQKCFKAIDFTSMGDISYTEFFEFLDLKRSQFTDMLYDYMRAKVGGQLLNFSDFLVIACLYCMYTKREILDVTFKIFDVDDSGSIDEVSIALLNTGIPGVILGGEQKEFVTLCSMINGGKPLFGGNFMTAMNEFDVDGDGVIDFREFQLLADRFPMLFFPAFILQDKLQKVTLGKDWLSLRRKLLRSTTGKKRSVCGGGKAAEAITPVEQMEGDDVEEKINAIMRQRHGVTYTQPKTTKNVAVQSLTKQQSKSPIKHSHTSPTPTNAAVMRRRQKTKQVLKKKKTFDF